MFVKNISFYSLKRAYISLRLINKVSPMILDKFPNADEFYKTYWGRQPFVVKGGITPALFDNFIDGDTLAGLSLEEEIKSRLVTTAPEGGEWSCEHGPFEEARFETLGEKHWSLLVQNVDKYHGGTKALLESFDFSPRWLLDDIMVSYSTIGGTVGPHTDSYHVFLVQGQGKRTWRIGNAPVENEECIEGIELKVLKTGFEGIDVEVEKGDVIYIPPHFAHEGMTHENAMTFSVGFLGPKMSELLIEYGYYLEQNEPDNTRYQGVGLNTQTAGAQMSLEAKENIKVQLLDTIHAQSFSAWLSDYFSPSKEDDC